ncbi:uncharacterized protein [Vulpes vulpes]|uniref:Basic proline-rich protein-like n=1 Tax=Vulpes vulpes TaxID=9627 RepID=A0ABM5A9P0_VULVU
MARKGGVGSPPHGPPVLFLLLLLLRPRLPSPLDAPPAPFPAPLPQMPGAKYSGRRGREMENSRARGERRAVAKLAAPGWRGGSPRGRRPRSWERTARAQLQLSAGAGAGRGARGAPGLGRACAPGARLPPACLPPAGASAAWRSPGARAAPLRGCAAREGALGWGEARAAFRGPPPPPLPSPALPPRSPLLAGPTPPSSDSRPGAFADLALPRWVSRSRKAVQGGKGGAGGGGCTNEKPGESLELSLLVMM